MKIKIGDEYSVFWETNDGRPSGQHKARVLAISKYTGNYPQWFTHVLTLACQQTRKGSLETVVNQR